MLMVKQQQKNLAADNEAIQAQQQVLPVSKPREFNQTSCCQQSQTQAQAAEKYT